jgi:hypothetical protein
MRRITEWRQEWYLSPPPSESLPQQLLWSKARVFDRSSCSRRKMEEEEEGFLR